MIKRILTIIMIMGIAGTMMACGHKHTFSEATCTSAKTCIDCGETEGEPLGHTWVEADCETPKTCSVCGTTEGEALGHSVDVGVCSVCNKIANEDLLNEVFDYFGKASAASTSAVNDVNAADVSSLSNTYDQIVKAEKELNSVESNMQMVYDLCGEYEGLKEIKNAAKAILDDIPSNLSGKDQDQIISWLTDYADYLKTCSSSFSVIAQYASTLSDAK